MSKFGQDEDELDWGDQEEHGEAWGDNSGRIEMDDGEDVVSLDGGEDDVQDSIVDLRHEEEHRKTSAVDGHSPSRGISRNHSGSHPSSDGPKGLPAGLPQRPVLNEAARQFVFPSDPSFMAASAMALSSSQSSNGLPPDWEVRTSRKDPGDTYYYNTKTRETMREKPVRSPSPMRASLSPRANRREKRRPTSPINSTLPNPGNLPPRPQPYVEDRRRASMTPPPPPAPPPPPPPLRVRSRSRSPDRRRVNRDRPRGPPLDIPRSGRRPTSPQRMTDTYRPDQGMGSPRRRRSLSPRGGYASDRRPRGRSRDPTPPMMRQRYPLSPPRDHRGFDARRDDRPSRRDDAPITRRSMSPRRRPDKFRSRSRSPVDRPRARDRHGRRASPPPSVLPRKRRGSPGERRGRRDPVSPRFDEQDRHHEDLEAAYSKRRRMDSQTRAEPGTRHRDDMPVERRTDRAPENEASRPHAEGPVDEPPRHNRPPLPPQGAEFRGAAKPPPPRRRSPRRRSPTPPAPEDTKSLQDRSTSPASVRASPVEGLMPPVGPRSERERPVLPQTSAAVAAAYGSRRNPQVTPSGQQPGEAPRDSTHPDFAGGARLPPSGPGGGRASRHHHNPPPTIDSRGGKDLPRGPRAMKDPLSQRDAHGRPTGPRAGRHRVSGPEAGRGPPRDNGYASRWTANAAPTSAQEDKMEIDPASPKAPPDDGSIGRDHGSRSEDRRVVEPELNSDVGRPSRPRDRSPLPSHRDAESHSSGGEPSRGQQNGDGRSKRNLSPLPTGSTDRRTRGVNSTRPVQMRTWGQPQSSSNQPDELSGALNQQTDEREREISFDGYRDIVVADSFDRSAPRSGRTDDSSYQGSNEDRRRESDRREADRRDEYYSTKRRLSSSSLRSEAFEPHDEALESRRRQSPSPIPAPSPDDRGQHRPSRRSVDERTSSSHQGRRGDDRPRDTQDVEMRDGHPPQVASHPKNEPKDEGRHADAARGLPRHRATDLLPDTQRLSLDDRNRDHDTEDQGPPRQQKPEHTEGASSALAPGQGSPILTQQPPPTSSAMEASLSVTHSPNHSAASAREGPPSIRTDLQRDIVASSDAAPEPQVAPPRAPELSTKGGERRTTVRIVRPPLPPVESSPLETPVSATSFGTLETSPAQSPLDNSLPGPSQEVPTTKSTLLARLSGARSKADDGGSSSPASLRERLQAGATTNGREKDDGRKRRKGGRSRNAR